MSTSIYITDDGDEQVFVKVNEEVIGIIDHGEFGWAGMDSVIKMIESIAETFGIPLFNEQDIL